MIRAENLVKQYTVGDDTIRALDGVSFEIASGEMVAITGSSGSGKSTLMHIVGCLDRPDEGNYFLAGQDVSRMSRSALADVRNKRIGFVFQTFNLLPRMNAIENVELPLLYAGTRHARQQAMVALEHVGLKDRMKHEPSQMSGGQRQRVAIARALVTNPTILLADEPTGNLDSRTGEEILALFKTLYQDGRTVVMVTHDPHVAGYCPRQIHLKDGKVVDKMG
jgi:putative ABC transport system ATP-binding protein